METCPGASLKMAWELVRSGEVYAGLSQLYILTQKHACVAERDLLPSLTASAGGNGVQACPCGAIHADFCQTYTNLARCLARIQGVAKSVELILSSRIRAGFAYRFTLVPGLLNSYIPKEILYNFCGILPLLCQCLCSPLAHSHSVAESPAFGY